MKPRHLALFAGVLLLATACSPFRSLPRQEQGGWRVVSGVPFRAQESRDDCGPAALASLLAHRGQALSLDEIAAEVYTPELRGTLLPDLENFLRRRGFASRSGRGDLALLRRAVDAGRPVVIPVETGAWLVSRPHYLVVYGYDAHRFLVHAGVKGGVAIAADDLLPRWEKMNRLYLYLD